MLRNLMCATFVLAITGLVLADEFTGAITKVDKDQVTVQKYLKGEKGKKGEKDGDPVTLTASKDVKVFKAGKKGAPGDPIDGGLTSETFTSIPQNGVFARITTDDSKKITQIIVLGGKKKKAAN
jgi:hypothetical protein